MTPTRLLLSIACMLAHLALPSRAAEAPARPARLRCEYLANPLGIDTPRPRLSWIMESAQRAQTQTAYQILVARSPETLAQNTGDLWDSGKVPSSQTLHIPYAGQPLASRQTCWWKVRLWDKNDHPSPWSDPAFWSVGLLNTDDWQARWITSRVRTTPAARDLGYHAAEADREDATKWVQIDLGTTTPIDQIRLHPVQHVVAGNHVPGFAFPLRFRVEASNDPEFTASTPIADHTAADYPNPGLKVVTFNAHNLSARYVRVTATKLWNRHTGPQPFCFALAELEVLSAGKNLAVQAPVTALDSTEAHGWAKSRLTDARGLAGASADDAPAAILLRKSFDAPRTVKRATAYVCGLGHYELHLNGRKVGNRLLEPAWTNYRKTCLYSTYDVTDRIQAGPNALGLLLGNGMYNVVGGRYAKFTGSFGPPKAIVQLELEFIDGTSARILSDNSWKASESPITFSCIYGGEDYDARKEQPGWDTAQFTDNPRWTPVTLAPSPGGLLRSQMMQPIIVKKTIPPIAQPRLIPGGCIYDLGQNFSGWIRVTVQGPAGSTIRFIPAERLQGDRADQSTSGGPTYFQYTLKGNGRETWSPRFSYTGFRYIRVEGATPAGPDAPANLPVIEHLEGQFLYPDVDTVGEFACSNNLLNRTHQIINQAILSNMKSVLTDCPHREKLGWLEEVHLMGPSIMFNYDVPALYAKIARDMAEAQLDTGLVPDIAPEYPVFAGGFRDSPEWGSACVIAPWLVFQRYGDKQILADHYAMMQRYVAYLGAQSKDYLVSHGLGDWYDIGPKQPGPSQNTPMAVTATIFYYHNATLLQQIATLLGKPDDARRYADLAAQIRSSFNQRFFHPDTHQYATGSQTANAMALIFNLVDPDRRPLVLANLIKDIRNHANHTTAGDVGHLFVLRALADANRSDVIFDMASRTDHPSYGYQVEHGATSLTEAWDGPTRGASQNHFMLGHIEEWFYRGLAGIHFDLALPQPITIRPSLVGDLTWARARYDSPLGRIVSDWKLDHGKLTLAVTIPANASALIHLPTSDPNAIAESGKPIASSQDVQFLQRDNAAAVFRVGSGSYVFTSPYSPK